MGWGCRRSVDRMAARQSALLGICVLGMSWACSGSAVDPNTSDTSTADTSAADTSTADTSTADTAIAPAKILSAFFGLDDKLPPAANFLCPGAAGRDGMPIVLDRRLAWTGTAQVPITSFRVTKADGTSASLLCATLAPATESSERHTILLIGDLGSHPSNPPARVEIVGPLPLEDGGDALGASTTSVVALTAGPGVVMAQRFDPTTLPSGGADDCPSTARVGIVRIAWNGGVSAPGGGAVGDAQRLAITVVLRNAAGIERTESPAALADANDNDNYLELCLATTDRAVRVRVAAGAFLDPNGDPNTEQTIDVP